MLGAGERRQRDPVGVVGADAHDVRARVTRDLVAVVVVHAQHVDRRRDGVEVTVTHHVEPGPVLPRQAGGVLEHVGRVGAAEDRVEEEPVVQAVDAPCGVDVGRVGGIARVRHGEVEAEPEPAVVTVEHERVEGELG